MDDTRTLLQSCHRGTVTAADSLNRVIGRVQNGEMRQCLQQTLQRHNELNRAIGTQLHRQHAAAETPPPLARAGVRMAAEMRLRGTAGRRDHRIAKLIIDGCNTGIQGVSEDLNHCPHASAASRDLAASLIDEEQRLMNALRVYL